MHRFVTRDLPWVHHCKPETTQQPNQWEEAGFSVPKEEKLIASMGKVIKRVFWDAKGILMITLKISNNK